MAKPNAKSALKFLVKIALSALAIYLVFSKIELDEVWSLVKESNPFYLLGALIFFNLSKFISAHRLLILFRAIGVSISSNYNLRLYYIGMFYNLFLPGGIGGDGYKIFHLNKKSAISKRELLSAVLLDRISGAALLAFLALAIASFQESILELFPSFWTFLVYIGAVLAIPALAVLIRLAFAKFKSVTFQAIHWSLWVQLSQLVCAWFILSAYGVHDHFAIYFVLFLVSSIAAMLPISFGGVGLRELVFLYASQELPIDETAAVALGLVFFLITALSSFIGVFLRLPSGDSLNKEESSGF
ncbi:lysylphosphatidylglycerol synthase transmembrane domain-containing protein [Cryomorphaceae bacterium 1068]|nr:lysylphosphatidylglycerol synthase transmembrane domain-containing protein [Cryomorphaceae bacterium 1068]